MLEEIIRDTRAQQERQEYVISSEDGLAVSEEEYWEKYYEHDDFIYEWNNGYLEEKPVSDYEGYLTYDWFNTVLRHYLKVYPIGKRTALEFGFRMALPGKTAIRKPDLAVVLNNNPAVLYLDDRTYAGIFDLCIEALSDSTKKAKERDTIVKKGEYELAGVREYYILDGKGEETGFYRLNKWGIYENIKPAPGGIIRSQVLPGFQFRVSDLYDLPSEQEMSEDKVYRKFMLPFYQAEKQRAEQERLRAEQEKQRAEQLEKQLYHEKQYSERLAEKLRSLGISIEE